MKIVRSVAAFLASALIVSLVLVPAVGAATSANVTATVTAQNVSVTLTSDGSVAFGTVTTSATADTSSGGVDDTETLQNNGNVNEDIDIKAQDSSSSGSGWTLGGTAGSETYTMEYCTSDCDGTPTWVDVGIHPSYVDLVDPLSSSGTQDFDLRVGTPTSTSDYNEQTITVTVLASAS